MGACLSPRRTKRATPPRDMANNKMTKSLDIVRAMVSKKKRRYVQDGFDLDLSYIDDNLIAMGFPSEKLERLYRNNIDDVVRFLELRHKDRYKIYNLCSERSYDPEKFKGRVASFPFDDHHPPKISLVHRFCVDVHEWLTADERNVAVVHCKAGKGRTGTMICCYLLYSGRCATAQESLDCFARERTHDLKGVTIPSQRRYVFYYASILNSSPLDRRNSIALYDPSPFRLLDFSMKPPPAFSANGGHCAVELHVVPEDRGHFKVRRFPVIDSDTSAEPFRGSVRIEVYNVKPKIKIGKEKLFHFWFDTYFVEQQVLAQKLKDSDDATYRLTFDKRQLDDAHKDNQRKLFGDDFSVTLILRRVPEAVWTTQTDAAGASRFEPPPSPSSSCAEEGYSDESLEPEEGWESGESMHV